MPMGHEIPSCPCSHAPGTVGLVVVDPRVVVRACGAAVGVGIFSWPDEGRRCTHQSTMILALANTGGAGEMA